MAWSAVPTVWTAPLWIAKIAFLGPALFTGTMATAAAQPLWALECLCFGLVELAAGVWSLVILVNCLAVVQRYSVAKAVLNVLAAELLIGMAMTAAGAVWALAQA